MKNAELYKGLTPEKQAEYEAWLVDRFGRDMEERIALSRQGYAGLGEEQRQQLQDELYQVEQGLAEGFRRGIPMGSPSLDPLLERHRQWVSAMWGRPCPPEAYAGLADLYLSAPDFVARFEAIEPGFAEYLAGSMKVHARRAGGGS